MAIAGRRGGRTKRTPHLTIDHMTNTTTIADKISKQLTGRRWAVDYFNKHISANETEIEFDENQPNHLKNFTRIAGLEIAVEDELPTTGKIFDAEGTGRIDVGIKPTKGDVFLATLSGHTRALLSVKEVIQDSYNNDAIYTIIYKPIKHFTTDESFQAFVDSISNTLVEDLVYDVEAISSNSTPILLRSNLQLLVDLKDVMRIVEEDYFNIIETQETRLPYVNDSYVLDSNIEEFGELIMGVGYVGKIFRTSIIGRKLNTILDVMTDEVSGYAKFNSFTKAMPKTASDLTKIKMLEMNYYLKAHTKFPTELSLGEKVSMDSHSTKSGFPHLFDTTYIFSNQFYGIFPINPVTGKPHVKFTKDEYTTTFTTNDDKYYQVNFTGSVDGSDYNNTFVLTSLETEVLRFIKSEPISIKRILELMKDVQSLHDFEKLYFIPILFLLGKTFLTNRADAF